MIFRKTYTTEQVAKEFFGVAPETLRRKMGEYNMKPAKRNQNGYQWTKAEIERLQEVYKPNYRGGFDDNPLFWKTSKSVEERDYNVRKRNLRQRLIELRGTPTPAPRKEDDKWNW